MRISRLIIRHFRNYGEFECFFNPGLNVIIGDNAAGKTNLLESICFLSTLHSHRTHNHRELIRHGADGMALEGIFEDHERYRVLCKVRASGKKEICMEGKRVVRYADIFGKIPVVWFSPDDLRLTKGEPELRRRWMDFILSQTHQPYPNILKRYHRIVIERNAALRHIQEGTLSADMLAPWDESLAREAVVIMSYRTALITYIEKAARKIYACIGKTRESISMKYQPSLALVPGTDPVACIQEQLRECRAAELMVGSTLRGPHRDDADILLDGRKARSFASQGQQRSIVLSIKLAEIDYIKFSLGICPIGLFDDVLSELDDNRSRGFWEYLLGGDIRETGMPRHMMQCIVSAVKIPGYVTTFTEPHIVTIQSDASVAVPGTL